MASKKISQLSSGSLSFLPLSGLTPVVYSGTTFQQTLSNLRQTLVDSGSHHFTGSQYINGDLTIIGSLTAQQYILSSSISNIVIENVSGSSNFGNDLLDIHNITGSVRITGSFDVTGSSRLQNTVIGLGLPHVDGPEILHVENVGSYNIAHFQGNSNIYTQINVQNTNSGNNASSDVVITADNGTESVHYVDLGINSSTYTGGLVGYANDSYLLNVGKDMYIGTVGGVNHPANLKLFAQNNWENAQIVISGSKQISFNTGSVSNGFQYEFSGSVKLDNNLNANGSITANNFTGSLDWYNLINIPTLVSSSNQILIGSGIWSGSAQLPSGLVSGSSQISYTGITDVPLGLVSGSSQVLDGSNVWSSSAQLPNGIISGSSQVIYSGITGIPLGIVSGSSQVLNGSNVWSSSAQLPSGLVSGSSQISYTGITDIPSNIISGSSQISDLGFAITGSNNFIGDQSINGILTIEGVSEVVWVDGSFSGNRDFDYTSGSIFYLTGITGNGTWNVNNVPTTNNRVTTMTFVIPQNSNAYSGSLYQINGSTVSVKWADNIVPTGSANNIDIIGLTAFRVGNTWNVIGAMTTFGV
jgi:hypothetical protein